MELVKKGLSAETNVKAGYKKTEVGVIPEDWEIGQLEELTQKIGSGITPKGGESVYKSTGRPFIRSQNIGWGKLLLDDIAFIDDNTHFSFPSTEVMFNDVFLNITGASIGRCSYANKMLIGGNVNQHVCILRTLRETLYPIYLCYMLLSKIGQKQIDSFQTGGNRQGLNFGQIKSFKIPLPPTLTEQKAIADALTDVDELITNLQKLIAKKKAIKQGAMQQLLTPPHKGGKRLEGFSGDWVEMRLGDIANFFSGGTPSTSNSEYYNGFIPWISSGELNNIRINQTNGFISRLGLENSSAKIVEKGTLLLAMYGATAGVCAITNIVGAINQAVLAIVPENYNSEYLFQFLRLNKEFIIKTYTQGGQPNLSGNVVKSIQAFFPASIEEQNEIANILFEMDLDIETLDNKLNKANLVKQGMMQELLTGKTRLV